ncbi:MAG: T9SS type A sorting domain-containing protein, partial [Leadbetterella sp.]
GGSLSHLDESLYSTGTKNGLMSPLIASREIIHEPGELILFMLNQLGWGIRGVAGIVVTDLEPKTPELVIYPNPVSDELHFLTRYDLVELQEAIVYDAKGLKVLKTNLNVTSQKSISVSNIASGIYYLQIGKSSKVRFVKL